MNHFSVHCDIQWKVDFNKTTSDFQLSDWTKKKLQSTYQSQTCTQKSSCSLLGGLLPIWSTKLSEFRGDHYIWEVCSANQWNAPKIPVLAASIGQQTNSSAWRCLKIHKTTSSLKVQQIGLGSFASSTIFVWPLADSSILTTSQGRGFHNQQETEDVFQEFTESQRMHSYTTGINKLISHWQKCVDCNNSFFY